jgi:Rps23 Pro-64 3,4-dihydroxylase Tpa1-like proline 4-hydroxylase
MIGKQSQQWEHFSVTGWMYPPGTGLSMHDDGSGVYSGAYVYFMNPVWRPHWGGLLVVMDEEANKKVFEYRSNVDEIDYYKRKWLHANPLDDMLMDNGLSQCIFPKRNRIVFMANDAYHMVTRVNEQVGDNLRMSLAGFFNKKR